MLDLVRTVKPGPEWTGKSVSLKEVFNLPCAAVSHLQRIPLIGDNIEYLFFEI